MISLNRAQIIGNLTRDPETRYTPSGQSVCHFAVATNRRWNNQAGERQEETEFHEVTAWGKLGEIISQIMRKGNKIFIEGRLQTRSWEAPDGSRRQRTEIIAENFVSLAPKGESGSYTPIVKEPVVSTPPPASVPQSGTTVPQSGTTAGKSDSEEAIASEPAPKDKKSAADSKAEENLDDLEDIPF